jgi:uncharacterized membrane protein (UPF0127 family)
MTIHPAQAIAMKSPTLLLPVALLACLLFMPGCGESYQAQLPTTQMRIGNTRFTLEIADEPTERYTGLMRRDSMPANHGMIFVFPDEQERFFHMKNTRIPLDILFVDTAGRIVSIKQMKPYNDQSRSDHPARYAIELNAGAAERVGVKAGDTLELPEDITSLQITE